MKQIFESVKLNRPTFNEEELRKIEFLADSILGHVIPHFINPDNIETSNMFLLNEHPVLKFCAILDAERVIKRNGLSMESWVDETTQIPTLNFKVVRNK